MYIMLYIQVNIKYINFNEMISFAFDKLLVAISHTLLYNHFVVQRACPFMRMRGSWFHLTKSKFTADRIRVEL